MLLLLPPEITARLVDALAQAGQREIGGILMGEHVGPDIFRVKDLTIQRKGGAFGAFVRIVAEILAPLRAFFDATKHDYTRFNYLGEWHSHHSFALAPSGKDHGTMHDIVKDPNLGARFVVLLLVQQNDHGQLDARVTVYLPSGTPYAGTVVLQDLAPNAQLGVCS